jgi:CheY-like chemotaxis protein
LLVDDDDAQREIVEEILNLEDLTVLSAGSSVEAVRLLGQEPQVVLLDLHGVDVEPLLEAIRGRSRRPALLVVSGDLRLPEHAARMGADGHLAKPYEIDDLLRAVEEMLARPRLNPPGAHA